MTACHITLRSLVPALAWAAVTAHAASFGVVDPRSMAMGGTGVSSATSGNASYYNSGLSRKRSSRTE